MSSYGMKMSQTQFLASGGVMMAALGKMHESGQMTEEYVYHEYPKMIRLIKGEPHQVERSTEDVKGRTLAWKETVTDFEDIVVNSEEEEERVLAGGKTSAQIELERQGLVMRCRAAGIQADPAWPAVRLRRELGDRLDAPEPVDKMGALEIELASLKKMAAMQAEIEALRAQIARPPEDIEGMRQELASLGIKADGRWSASRLREELERATRPELAA